MGATTNASTYIYASLLLAIFTLNSLHEIINHSKSWKYYETYEVPIINLSLEIFQAFLALLWYKTLYIIERIKKYEIEFHFFVIHLHLCDFTIHIFLFFYFYIMIIYIYAAFCIIITLRRLEKFQNSNLLLEFHKPHNISSFLNN